MSPTNRNTITEFGVRGWLCDSAVTAEGKLYVQGGGWNLLSPPVFPAQLPRIGIAICVDVPYTATNQTHTLTITLQGEDGQLLGLGPVLNDPTDPAGIPKPGQIEAQFNLGRPPGLMAGDAQPVPFALNIDGYMLASPGAYAFVVSIDGTEMERLIFRAVPAMPMGMPGGIR